MKDVKVTEGEPHDRLTRICDAMTRTLERHPEAGDDVKAVIMLDDDKMGDMVIHGYKNNGDAIVNVFEHLRAVFEANGQTLVVAPLGGDG